LKFKIFKIAFLCLLSVIAFIAIGLGGIYLRLTKGPLAVGFLHEKIESAISSELHGMSIKLGDSFLAIDPQTNIPHVRFNNLVLYDSAGNVLATSPQAAVTLDKAALLSGQITPRSLEFIGPKINARRNVDGSLILGTNGTAAIDFGTAEAGGDGKTDQAGNSDAGAKVERGLETTGAKLIEMLDQRDQSGALSALEDIRITDASLYGVDDGNGVTWHVPRADMTYKKMPYGFVILAKVDVATSAKPWHAELSATYRHDNKKFEISSTLDNVVPATVAEKIYALSQFAAVTTPLSGHIELEAGADGVIVAASGEFQAKPGKITLPDYFAEPIAVDEGALRVAYVPETAGFSVANSSLVVAGRRVDLTGMIQPLRNDVGKLTAISLKLATQKAADDTAKISDTLVDKIEFSGQASVDQARLDIEDLVVTAANTGVRLRGYVTGGNQSPGIHVAGRVRDISVGLLKSLWPPIVAPHSRTWVNENVTAGQVSEGTFQINFAENALAKAAQSLRNPNGSIDFSFALKNVTTHYFKDLPVVKNASGQAHLIDNDFEIKIAGGTSQLEGGEVIMLKNGLFLAPDILAVEVPGSFNFDLEAPVASMLAFAAQPNIKMIKPESLADFPDIKGTAHVKLGLKFPLVEGVTKDRVQLSTDVTIKDVSAPAIGLGMDLSEGSFNITVSPNKIDVVGPAKINGLPAKIAWSKPRDGGDATASFSAVLDEKSREKMGIKLSDYLTGPVPVEAKMQKDDAGNSVIDIKADLSSAAMRLAAVSWKRAATEGTFASFRVRNTDAGRSIQDFKLDGDGLHLRGAIELTTQGKLKTVAMDEIRLQDDNPFSVRATPGDGTVDLEISGSRFDARPYIKTLISAVPKSATGNSKQTASQDFTMRAHFDRVTANRGEVVNDVNATLRARGGKIAEANLQGTYINGQTIRATVVPLPEGREMRVKSSDAGSTMRAANFYSKIAGGALDFYALIGNEEGSPIRNGNLIIHNFDVRNEATLAQLDKRGQPTKTGPRKDGVSFSTLYLPFTADNNFVRFKNVTVRGNDMCATADGVVRKADNALDVSGTVVPACGLSRVFNNVPIIGDILSGGNYNEGIFGVTYAIGGTLTTPQVQVNPLSALAPGIFRRLFDFNPKPAPPAPPGTK
jgi:Protein of unknown function/AsmA-like C-terminal region